MAVNADSVVYEVEAKMNTASARAAEAQFDQSMNRISGSAGKAEKAIEGAFDKPMLNATTRTRQLGIQIGQLGSSLGSGIPPMVVFAQQASDFTYVLAGTQGVAGKLATFFSGPWGSALLAAGIVLSIMISKHKAEGDAVEESLEKLKRHREETVASEQAHRVWANTLDGVTEAIEENEKALGKLVDREKDAATEALGHALAARQRLELIKAEAEANLDLARSLYEVQRVRASGPGQQGELAALNLPQRLGELDRIQNRLADINVQIEKADSQIRQATAAVYAEAAGRDTVEGIHLRYKNLIADATRVAGLNADAAAKAGDQAKAQRLITTELQRQVTALKIKEAAEVKAAEARSKPDRGAQQIGTFIMPVAGRVSSGFGPRVAPTAGASTFHPAIDIAAPMGTPVKAAAGGVVITTGRMGGLGNVVIIDHGGGTITEYGHLSAITARQGQRVDQGDVIGNVGSTGISTGPHLDYRVRTGGKYVDPRTGRFPVDEVSAGQRALQAAEKAERDRTTEEAKQRRQTNAFNAEMQQLQGDLIVATRKKATSFDDELKFSEENVTVARDRANLAYEAAASEGRITEAQAKLLIEKNNEVAAAKIASLEEQERVRRLQVLAQTAETRQEIEVATREFEVDQAKTSKERRDAALRLLDAELELERMKLQQVVDNTKIGSAEHEIAVIRLADLDRIRGQRTTQIKRDPQNMSPGENFLASLPTFEASVEDTAVDAMKKLNDEITGAIMGTESLGDAWRNVGNLIVEQLLRIAIQQLIIKPMAELLFGSGAGGFGGGGGGGGILGSLLGLFGGGGGGDVAATASAIGNFHFASGGAVRGGRPIMVGESGKELFVPTSDGMIVPNGALARPGYGDGAMVEVVVTAGEYFDARVGQVTGPVIARASMQAANGGSILARQKMGKTALHRLE